MKVFLTCRTFLYLTFRIPKNLYGKSWVVTLTDQQMKYLQKRIYVTKACVESLTNLEQVVCNALIAEGEIVLVDDSPTKE